MKRSLFTIGLAVLALQACDTAQDSGPISTLWEIGTSDNSPAEFAMAPDGYSEYVTKDFGFEDRQYVIGHSTPAEDCPYALPGPLDEWGGTSYSAGWRTHDINILFGIDCLKKDAEGVLEVDLVDVNPRGSVVKLSVNGRSQRYELTGTSDDPIFGNCENAQEKVLRFPVKREDLIRGDNHVCVSVAEGYWILIDQIRMLAKGVELKDKEHTANLLDVKTIKYDLNGGPKQKFRSVTDYVDTSIGVGHSRWMIAPGPWMPFSMVKLSPDNQNPGWQGGYQHTIETLGCMSHIHEWTMAGLGMMPTNGPLQIQVGDQLKPDEGYRSRIDKSSEKTPLGYYSVRLTDTDILLEASATTRCSMQRYTFPSNQPGRVMIDLQIPAEYTYQLEQVEMKQISDYRIEGFSHQLTPRVWGPNADQEYTIHFVMEFDKPIQKSGYWVNDSISEGRALAGEHLDDAGFYVEFDTKENPVVQVRTGISFVSLENAALNLETEIVKPCGWNLDKVVKLQRDAWEDLLGRVEIETDVLREKVRFYTNLYRSMCRNTFSDVNGDWMGPDGNVHRFEDPQNEVALGCDAFWNTFWNLNQVWNLITPEWASRWVHSQLAMYDAGGWLAKGPAGMKYIPVMVAEHEIPQMVSTWQMGIRDYDAKHALEAMIHQQTAPAVRMKGGYAGNDGLFSYLKYHYIPIELGTFSNSLEYSFDDWTVGQFALALGDEEAYKTFNERGSWWRNAINPEDGYAHMRDSLGGWVENFDPFKSGVGAHYVEGNAWQLSYFVPQDLPGLVDIMGKKAFVERLDWGFQTSDKVRYNAPNDVFESYPVVQGNQQSMHFAFLFNWAGRPDLTQKWTRSILDRYYGYGQANAYLGDEDQGQMSAWFVMASLGLFQTDGGCRTEPIYEIASPLYPRVTIHLGERYGRGKDFVIEAHNTSATHKYVQSATLNGKKLDSFYFPASELLKGGKLVLEMSDTPK